MILNLHGLNGRRKNNNYQQLIGLFDEGEIYSPQIDYLAQEPRSLLTRLADEGPYSLVVGHSLGGFFAFALGAADNVPTVITNPCIPPHEYLPALTDSYRQLDTLKAMWEEAYATVFNCNVIVGAQDEVIDHRRTLQLMEPRYTVATIDSAHSMSGADYVRTFAQMCTKAIG